MVILWPAKKDAHHKQTPWHVQKVPTYHPLSKMQPGDPWSVIPEYPRVRVLRSLQTQSLKTTIVQVDRSSKAIPKPKCDYLCRFLPPASSAETGVNWLCSRTSEPRLALLQLAVKARRTLRAPPSGRLVRGQEVDVRLAEALFLEHPCPKDFFKQYFGSKKAWRRKRMPIKSPYRGRHDYLPYQLQPEL